MLTVQLDRDGRPDWSTSQLDEAERGRRLAAARDEFNPGTTYRRFGDGATAVPLLGVAGGEIASIPFFAEPRAADMTTQPDWTNRKTLSPGGAAEFQTYFGCWLDFNQTTPRFPLNPSGDGPFSGDLKTIQELIRGRHQCLIAEVHYPPDPIPNGAGPGSSDNLSHRNLAIVESANPGNAATHTVQHTFELRPTTGEVVLSNLAVAAPSEATVQRSGPDELIIRWGNLPRDSHVTLYLPDVDVNEVLAVAGMRSGPPVLQRVDDHTIRCLVGDNTFFPLPGARATNIPGLITIQLPPNLPRVTCLR